MEATGKKLSPFLLAKFAIVMKADVARSTTLVNNYLEHIVPKFNPEGLRAHHVKDLLQRKVRAH